MSAESSYNKSDQVKERRLVPQRHSKFQPTNSAIVAAQMGSHPPLRKIGFLAKARLHYLHTESAFSVS